MKRTSMLVNGLLADLTNKGTRFGGSFTIIGVGALLLELFNIGRRLEALRTDLAGDVKKLTARTHEYRLRVGDFRVLFMLEGDLISAYAVKDRKEAYG